MQIQPTSIPFTQQAFDSMNHRKVWIEAEIKEVLARLNDAREQGDLSENGAYKYAKQELGNLRRELTKLTHLLSKAKVAQPNTDNKAGFGKKVTIKSKNKKITFLLVSEYESNPSEGKLSTKSPLGRALLSKEVGDEIDVTSPNGSIQYCIEAIE